jgi:hypothetical protein
MTRTKPSVMPSETLQGSITEGKGKGKTIPVHAYYRRRGFQESEDPRFRDNRQMNLASLSALCTSRLYPPKNIPGTHLCQRLSRLQRHCATKRITSIKNRTRDLSACSAVPQSTSRPRDLRVYPVKCYLKKKS